MSQIIALKGSLTSAIRHETFEGRRHLVAPVALLVEGVHTGMGGRSLYYPAAELARHPASWNGRPVPLFHPTERDAEGEIIPVSANSPEVLQRESVGYLFNAWYDEEGKALRAEIWVDEERARRKDPGLIASLERGEKIEVSTGLWGDIEEVGGVWNGEVYEAIFRNYLPDHLALLPGGEGACNLKDGCGVFNQGGGMDPKQMMGKMKQVMGRMKSMMDEVMREMETMPEGMADKDMVRKSDMAMMEKPEGNEAVNKAKAPPDTNQKKEEDPDVNKEQMISALIANQGTPWGEADRTALLALSEEQLARLSPKEASKIWDITNMSTGEKKPEPPTANCETCANKKPARPATVDEYINQAPQEMRAILGSALQGHREKKAILVQRILGNERNKFSEAALNGKGVDELEAIVSLIGESYAEPEGAFNFAGQLGGGYQTNSGWDVPSLD